MARRSIDFYSGITLHQNTEHQSTDPAALERSVIKIVIKIGILHFPVYT
jgi:hypothetical protein